ncbi:MAG: hypothetical protein V8R30_02510 [Clostridia bacterium]|jgi:hypothetical protein
MEFITMDMFLTVVGCSTIITLLTQVFKRFLPETIDSKWLALAFSIIVGIIRIVYLADYSFAGVVTGIVNIVLLLAIAIGEYEVVKSAGRKISELIKKEE